MDSAAPFPRNAFVLDDEPRIATLVANVLRSVGVDAYAFTNPGQFLVELRLQKPDLVVLDVTLGSSDAIEVIRQLDVVKFSGRVMLMSGHAPDTLDQIERIGRSHGLAMLPSLRKPFRASEIRRSLEACVETDTLARVEAPSIQQAGPDLRVNLREALERNWLEVWYQPKVDLKSLTVCGAEALVRARHPEHGVLTPVDLLPPAGDPLYQPLTSFVLRRTLADWEVFADNLRPLKLSVNVPISVLNAPGFVTMARDLLPRYPKFPGLIIEVTEDEIVRDPQWLHEIATQLRLYKVFLSIDDFGSAYASLSRVRDIPFVEIKLDRSFVTRCAVDPLKRTLCENVIDLAHRCKASLCAEGVETAEDLRCLIALGCDTAQGYFFARPMTRDAFLQSLLQPAR